VCDAKCRSFPIGLGERIRKPHHALWIVAVRQLESVPELMYRFGRGRVQIDVNDPEQPIPSWLLSTGQQIEQCRRSILHTRPAERRLWHLDLGGRCNISIEHIPDQSRHGRDRIVRHCADYRDGDLHHVSA
jgi:hypothetical protein